ncbi:hypothetical protein [Streptomyces aquilus]|uniref:hypothetical protein n=1 Tax=Streptomyces aquilus TaxID=2548456 RepID=UPI001FCA85D7|nr:hypothetical protein [Streptomyces aquilus]
MGSSSLPAARHPFRAPAPPTDRRADDLLGRLTLAERIALPRRYAPAVGRLGIASLRAGTEALYGVHRLGEAKVFPQAVPVELRALHYHRPTANDIGSNGLQAVNLLRDPRGCRNEEGCSEDPVHTTPPGRAYGAVPADGHPTHVRAAGALEHFLACNNEDHRCVTSSGLRPRDPAAFRPAVASGAATGAMAAYPLANGRPCHVSPLIETGLRSWFAVCAVEAPSDRQLSLRPPLGRQTPARRGVDVLRRAGDKPGTDRRTARRGRPRGPAATDLVPGRRRVPAPPRPRRQARAGSCLPPRPRTTRSRGRRHRGLHPWTPAPTTIPRAADDQHPVSPGPRASNRACTGSSTGPSTRP